MQRQSRVPDYENAPFSSAFDGGFDATEIYERRCNQATVRYPRHIALPPARVREKSSLAYRTGTGEHPRPLVMPDPEAARSPARSPIPKTYRADIARTLESCWVSASHRSDRNGVGVFKTGVSQI